MSTKLTKKERESRLDAAKVLFMEYKSITEIAKLVGLPRTTIDHHAKTHWEHERALQKAELFNALADSKRVDFSRMTQSAITVMARALQSLATRDRAPNVHEAKKASEILDILDKITRLDDSSPTEIIANEKPITIVELKKKMAVDPFVEIDEGEYQEIEAPKEKSDD